MLQPLAMGMNKKTVKSIIITVAVGILNFMGGYGFSYLLPTVLATGLNLLKGPVNNPDGEFFMFFGWLILAAMIAAMVALIIISAVCVRGFRHKYLILALLLLLMVAGITFCIVQNQIYYDRLLKEIVSRFR